MRAARLGGWTWLRWLALLALLVHAGLVVRHNRHALGVAFVSLTVADGVICRGDPTAVAEPMADNGPAPASAHVPCPICCGSAGGPAPPPSEAALVFAFADEPLRTRAADLVADKRTSGERPPSRGPPRPA